MVLPVILKSLKWGNTATQAVWWGTVISVLVLIVLAIILAITTVWWAMFFPLVIAGIVGGVGYFAYRRLQPLGYVSEQYNVAMDQATSWMPASLQSVVKKVV